MKASNFKQVLVLICIFLTVSCLKPNPDNKKNGGSTDPHSESTATGFLHENLKSCNGCHAELRPAPPHDPQADCIGCHTYPRWKDEASLGIHNPMPASCVGCHEKDRPALPHVATGDCVGCHSFPKFAETKSSFNHQPLPQACISCHEKDRPPAPHIRDKDCVSCHSFPKFAQLSFTHTPKPASCTECHQPPATIGSRAYPNQGPPGGFDPNNATAPGSRHYAGKDCSACHATPDEGASSFAFTHSKPKANFCLPCHFNQGQGEHIGDANVMLSGFGNCFTCHQNFDRNALRNWNPLNGDDDN